MTRISSINNFSNFTGVYCFGFQRQEQDEELWEGAVTFKYRVEDARLGRFFSVDPLFNDYPFNSNYAFCENDVIAFIELEGLEKSDPNRTRGKNGCEWQDNSGEDRRYGRALKLFTAEEVTVIANVTWTLSGTRWNRPTTLNVPTAGNLTFLFQTEIIPDQLIVTGPNRTNVNSGMISTNPNAAQVDPGQQFTSNGVGAANIQVIPNPPPRVNNNTAVGRFFGNLRNRFQRRTVYSLTVTDSQQIQTTTKTIKFLGLIPVKREQTTQQTQGQPVGTTTGYLRKRSSGDKIMRSYKSAKKILKLN